MSLTGRCRVTLRIQSVARHDHDVETITIGRSGVPWGLFPIEQTKRLEKLEHHAQHYFQIWNITETKTHFQIIAALAFHRNPRSGGQ